MTVCSEPSCRIKDNNNMIACASPFCQKKFHLNCVGLKGKPKEEIASMYFVCLSCDEFIRYSNNRIDVKLTEFETELTSNIQSIKLNITSLERNTANLSLRIGQLEKTLLNNEQKIEGINEFMENTNNKIALMETDLKDSVLKLNNQINALESKLLTNETKHFEPKENTQIINGSDIKYQIRVMGVKEAPADLKYFERQEHERSSVTAMLAHLNESNIHVKDCYRLGKFKAGSPRPRTMLVTLTNIWDKRKILSKVSLLSTYEHKLFVSPALSPSEINKEKMILKKRYELIKEGVDRRDIKIKNLKLFVKDEEITITSD